MTKLNEMVEYRLKKEKDPVGWLVRHADNKRKIGQHYIETADLYMDRAKELAIERGESIGLDDL